jgi:hypothetical protein
MKAHVIESGKVVNTIEVDSLDFMPGLVEGTVGGIGWLFDGQTFTDPRPAEPDPTPAPAPAPTKEQLLAQLNALSAQIQALE